MDDGISNHCRRKLYHASSKEHLLLRHRAGYSHGLETDHGTTIGRIMDSILQHYPEIYRRKSEFDISDGGLVSKYSGQLDRLFRDSTSADDLRR